MPRVFFGGFRNRRTGQEGCFSKAEISVAPTQRYWHLADLATHGAWRLELVFTKPPFRVSFFGVFRSRLPCGHSRHQSCVERRLESYMYSQPLLTDFRLLGFRIFARKSLRADRSHYGSSLEARSHGY